MTLRANTAEARWREIHARLAAVRARVHAEATSAPERDAELLAARARELARPVSEPDPRERDAVVVVRRGAERFAAPATAVVELCRISCMALLPGAQPPVVAVGSHRGELLMIAGLGGGAAGPLAATEGSLVLVVRHQGATLGLLVDEVLDLAAFEDPLPPAPGAPPYAAGATPTGITMLDVAALVRPSLERRTP